MLRSCVVVLRTCTVAVKDVRDVEHSIEVTAETLYEAIATALAALQQDNWVGEIGQGFATVTVLVQQPPVKHEVKMKDFVSWLGRQGRSPAEVMLKQKLEKILGKSKPCEDVTETTKHTNQQEEISEVSLTRSLGRFVGALRLLPGWRSTRFRACGLRDRRTWREGVLSLKHRRCNETKKYHPAQQSPHENDWLPGHENLHGRTSGDEERLAITPIILRKNQTPFTNIGLHFFFRCCRARSRQRERSVAPSTEVSGSNRLHAERSAFSEGPRDS